MSDIKFGFATAMQELSSTGSLMATDCEKYGMTWGCDEDCPVLNEGKCELYKDVDEYLEDINCK